MVAGSVGSASTAIAALDANAQAVKVPIVALGLGATARTDERDGVLCATVRPAVRREAQAAAQIAQALGRGDEPASLGLTTVTIGTTSLPGILVAPGDPGEGAS